MAPRSPGRRPSKHLRPARPLGGSGGTASTADKRDGRWVVRTVAGASATKTYRCPGCQHEVGPGVPHVVVWPHAPAWNVTSPVAERRHWHTACWARRP